MDMYGNIQKYMDIMICFKRLFSFCLSEEWLKGGLERAMVKLYGGLLCDSQYMMSYVGVSH